MALTDKLTAIGNAIREKTGKTDLIPLADMPNEILNISSGDNHYDLFWDNYQNYGKLKSYQYAFSGERWNVETFNPKYDIVPTNVNGASYMFANSTLEIDLAEHLENIGITLDLSNVTQQEHVFYYSNFTRIGVIDASNATRFYQMFRNNTKLKTIDKIILNENAAFSNTFHYCSALENLTIEGTIGQDGLNLQWSTLLTKRSIESVIEALSKTTSGLTVTLSKTAANNAFGIDVDDKTTYTEEFNTLINSKNNWKILFQ